MTIEQEQNKHILNIQTILCTYLIPKRITEFVKRNLINTVIKLAMELNINISLFILV